MLQPLQDRIVIKQDTADDKIGLIIVPDEAREKPLKGIVEAVGPGRVLDTGERLTPGVKPGDAVLFTKFSGTEIEVDEKSYLVVHEADVIGIIHRPQSS